MIKKSMMVGCMVCGLTLVSSTVLGEDNIVFPANSGVVDLTQSPYNCDPTGNEDISEAFARATEETRAMGDWGTPIIYLPIGTYLVRNTLTWRFPPGTIGPHLVGQSRTGTVIRLEDGTWPEGTEAKAVIQTGEGVAQNFNRGLFNLTVNIGSNNAGAHGVYWYGNNSALMSDVDIISEDGNGLVGLYLSVGEQGPSMARRVSVTGFRVGITSEALASVTLSEISLTGQSAYGVGNNLHPMWIDSLYSNNTVQAVKNSDRGAMVLINSLLVGGSSTTPAIRNDRGARIFLKNVQTEGYSKATDCISRGILTEPEGSDVDEYSSHGAASLFQPTPGRTLDLPRKRPPPVAWEEDLGKWANVDDYRGGRTDDQALQAAIDDPGKTTVYVPWHSHYSISGEVYVRGAITRIIGTGGCLRGPGSLVLTDGSAPAVMLQKLGTQNAAPGNEPELPIVQRSNRTLIAETILCGPIIVEAGGDVFGTDIVFDGNTVNHPDAHAWFWQFNGEGANNLIVRDGSAWVFGWKDEGESTTGQFTGGQTEIYGYLQQCADVDVSTTPLFVVSNASFSVASVTQTNFGPVTNLYEILVRETSGGETRDLLASESVNQWQVSLFTNAQPSIVADGGSDRSGIDGLGAPRVSIAGVGNGALYLRVEAGMAVCLDDVRVSDIAGRCVFRSAGHEAQSGLFKIDVGRATLSSGVYTVQAGTGSGAWSARVVVK